MPSCGTLAGRLDAAVSAGETSALTMVASPRALGMIRADYSDVVRKALQGEVGKDLVKLPVYEIEKQLLLSGAAEQAAARRGRASAPQIAGVPAAVLADIGGRALVAVVVRRAVVEGEGAGGDAGPVIVQIADRVGQRVGVVAVVPVVSPRLRKAGGAGLRPTGQQPRLQASTCSSRFSGTRANRSGVYSHFGPPGIGPARPKSGPIPQISGWV